MAAMNADLLTETADPDADALIARAVEQARAAVGLPEGARAIRASASGSAVSVSRSAFIAAI